MNSGFEQEEIWRKDLNNWKIFYLFYFNKNDNRIFVSKYRSWMGITVNFANPKSYLALAAIILFFGFITFMITNKN